MWKWTVSTHYWVYYTLIPIIIIVIFVVTCAAGLIVFFCVSVFLGYEHDGLLILFLLDVVTVCERWSAVFTLGCCLTLCFCFMHTQPYTGGDEEEAEPLPPNPFSELSERDLDDYKQQVEHQQLGLEGNTLTRTLSSLSLFYLQTQLYKLARFPSKLNGGELVLVSVLFLAEVNYLTESFVWNCGFSRIQG